MKIRTAFGGMRSPHADYYLPEESLPQLVAEGLAKQIAGPEEAAETPVE